MVSLNVINCHLLEIALRLLIHRKTPKYFRSDAVLTTCYLINQIPSSFLQNQILCSVLCRQNDMLSVPPKIFRCTCFVQVNDLHKTKLDSRVVKYIFLRYS